MKNLLVSLLIVFSTITIIPIVKAAAGPAVADCDMYRHQAVAAIINVISAGDNEVWANMPGCGIARSATQIFQGVAVYNGPVFTSATAPAFAWSLAAGGGATGCTVSSENIASSSVAGGAESEYQYRITMTSNECRALMTFSVNVIVAAVTVYQWRTSFPINIRVEAPNLMWNCRATGFSQNAYTPNQACNENLIMEADFLCDAPGIVPQAFAPGATTCNDPNIALTGTLTLAGTINVVNSGGQNIAITSWPQLQTILCGATTSPNTGLCATPTFNIQNTAGQTFSISGTLNTVLSGTTNNVLSGTVNVVNSGGQSISVTSWPQLQAVLSGKVDILNFLCAATGASSASYTTSQVCNVPTFNVVNSGTQTITLAGTINTVNSGTQHLIIDSWPSLISTVTNSGTISIQNTAGQTFALSGTVNTAVTGSLTVTNQGGQTISISSWPQLQALLSGDVNFHQDEACGATVHCKVDMTCLSGTCQSMVANSTITVNQNNTSTNNLMLGIIPYNLLLVAIAFFAIAGEAKKDLLYWIMCLILSIVLIFVRPSTSIVPVEFFVGWIFIVLYQTIVLFFANRSLTQPAED